LNNLLGDGIMKVVKVNSVVSELEFQKNKMIEFMKSYNTNEDDINIAITFFNNAIHGVEDHLEQFDLKEELKLEELLKKCNEENRHEEMIIDTQGKELL
jgi:hypothetical protein